MWSEWFEDNQYLGLRFETEEFLGVFGSAILKRDALKIHFPDFDFRFVHQVHGTEVIDQSQIPPKQLVKADGHVSKTRGQALVIQTADCIPLLLFQPGQVAALHAGWRGVAGQIVKASRKWFSVPPDLALVGPHIVQSSFEVGRDVAERLRLSDPNPECAHHLLGSHEDASKCRFDLDSLLDRQILAEWPKIQIHRQSVDTMTDPRFHSFRRDGSAAGRQFSFVVLKD